MNIYTVTLKTGREVEIKAYTLFHAGTKARSIFGNRMESLRLTWSQPDE